MEPILQSLLEASRPTKRMISISYDILALSLSLYLAWSLRTGSLIVSPTNTDVICLLITITVSILVFVRLGLYRAILRYMAHDAVVHVIVGLIISSSTLAATSVFLDSSIPHTVPFIYLLSSVFLVGLPRVMVRNVVQLLFPIGDTKVLIYGAGGAGRMLANSLRQSKEFQPVAFLDDDKRLYNSHIQSLPVYPSSSVEHLLKDHDVSKIFLALGGVNRTVRHHIVRELEKHSVQIQTIPPLEDLTDERVNIDEIRDIQIEDLLGRDPVKPNSELLRTNIENKVVMVTGAGGSIGSELCRQIINNKPKTLVLFELNEFNLYQIEDELLKHIQEEELHIRLVPLLGSVRDQNRLEVTMSNFKVQTVYHAAAYKHVPLVEHNMIEGVRNNVLGTYHCALAANQTGVETFVLISTDKAVRANNVMGASKRLAELVVLQASQQSTKTRFCTVRFGNVLGSSGSVVPRFREQIAQGGPVTVTHPDITRYFMTIPEAAQLVVQAGALANGGETYVLEMGEPVKIVELAQEMIQLSGLSIKDENNPDGDLEIIFSGLRPGEKLYEELMISDNIIGTNHPRITEALEPKVDQEEVTSQLQRLIKACETSNCSEVHSVLMETPTVYAGKDQINDLTHKQKQQNNVVTTLPVSPKSA